MAVLKDSLITGDLRVTGTIYGDVPLDDLVDADDLKAIEALSGSGIPVRTGNNTWTINASVPPSAHAHGNLTSDGKVGADANKAIYTGTGGAIQAGTLPVAGGGTGVATLPANKILLGNGTTAIKTGNINYTEAAGSKSGTMCMLRVWGPTAGNTAANLVSQTAGVLRFNDPGPQIQFGVSETGGQQGALIFTDHDSAGNGVSWHFVSSEGDNNNGGEATVTAPRFRARAGLTVGQNSDDTSYTFKVNGTSRLNGNATLTGLFAISNSNNTVTIGSQNPSFTHIYNSANVPFIFNKDILVTDKHNLGNESFPFGRLQLGTANDGIYYKGSKANYRMIRMIDNTDNAWGNGIGIGGGGLVVIGAGEYSDSLISASSLTGGAEDTYIGADSSIFIEAGGDTIANRIGIQIDTSGNIVPIKAEAGNNNAQSLGTSSYKWANAYATTFHGALDGNASTATKLQTARTINGTSFDGSANITTANWGTSRTITIGSTGKSVNGSANVSWTLAEIGAAASGHTHDDRYYTEAEVNSKLSGKANANHTHDDRYYTESETDTKLKTKASLVANTTIPYGADLNSATYQVVGSYGQPSSVNGSSISNTPFSGAFMLNVYNPLSSDTGNSGNWIYRLQEVIQYDTGRKWYRLNCTDGSGTWSYGAWRQVAFTGELQASVSNEILTIVS